MFFNKSSDNLPYEKIGKEVRCIADEIPFEIPDSWEWVRLGMIVILGFFVIGVSEDSMVEYVT